MDTEAIFGDKEKAKKEILPQESDLAEEFFTYFTNQVEEFAGIHIHNANKGKFRELYSSYVRENNIKDMPKLTKEHHCTHSTLNTVVPAHARYVLAS